MKKLLLMKKRDGVSLKTPRPRGWVGAGRPSGCKSSFNKRNMYQYPRVSQLFILLPWQSRVYPEPLKVVEFVQLTTECCWGQPSDPCQRGCLTSHACVMWGPRTLNADDDDDEADELAQQIMCLSETDRGSDAQEVEEERSRSTRHSRL